MPGERVVRVIATVAAVAVVLGTGVAWGKVRSFEDGIFHVFAPSLGQGGDDGAIDILLVGMDSRTDARGNPLSAQELAALRAGNEVASNTDTIILVRIPNSGKSATAISIPRDTYVAAPGLGKTKINGVYGQTKEEKRVSLVKSGVAPAQAEAEGTEAGREALVKTVADLTGVTVDHYAEIGLLGFALITDALGGVNVCLKAPVYEPLSGADFPAGWQKLNGPQALSFVRQRHDLPRGDLDRVVRQQVVMASLAHQVISGKTLSSPATMNRLQLAIQRSVVLSSGWDIMDFVNQLQKLAAGRIAFATIPVLDESGWSDDGMHSVVRVDPHQVQDWVAGLLHDQAQGKSEELAYTPDKTTASVLNDTDVNGLAAAVSAVLTAKGFAAGTVGNNDAAHVSASQVQAAKADDLGAQAVAKDLGGLPVSANPSLPAGSVRVVLANDYTGPGSGLGDGAGATAAAASHSDSANNTAPPPSPILTAGSEHPECVN
ncbi:LCP family protein [Candidatus Mycobacterium methanotrophicum]|uniref:LCP family protein n=1 Tax=Candidatus Mycobacterium methanotrophicum TaxID=2943498 RepID=A0ABY4QNC5_9MYCO|nr:LCP family protein [Candidatus Mycobacterium methanotrophicum]UQX12374.1 LCP family protein [Candidatus Mycobacterium methanotrophicum]